MADQIPASTNIVRAEGHVGRAERAANLGHASKTVWFTGLSGSGKSTLAFAVERALIDAGVAAYVLDGDNVRFGLNADLGFSPEDRTENIRRIGEVCRLFSDAGIVKGLYKKARTGEIPDFSGISAPYEAPENPEIRVDSSQDLDSCIQQILTGLNL